jgi:hypothetical protein
MQRRLRCASFRGPKRWQSEGAKWRLGRTFHPAVWRYHAGSDFDSSSCLVEPLQFVVINFCNVRTRRSALTVAHLFKNYTNRTPALSHKTLAIALPAQVRTFEFVLTHPPYSPHFAPSDCHCFWSVKDALRRCRFADDDELTHSASEGLRHFS